MITEQITFLYIILFVGLLAFSLLINGLFLKFSKSLGMRDVLKNEIRWSSSSKPALGGISFYIVFLITLVSYFVLYNHDIMESSIQVLGLIAACTLGFLIGLADDSFNTKPLLKFLGQLFSAFILIASDIYIHIFSSDALNYFITVFWVVGIMNSVNMLDNMDGIVSSVASVVLAALGLQLIFDGQVSSIYFVLIFGILASLLGFLRFNWNPSRLYMGDSGSQFLGIFLAAATIPIVWNSHDTLHSTIPQKLVKIALLFSPFIIDTTTVTINRLLRGQSPFVGGKDHTTHHLAVLLKSDRKVAYIFLAISLLTASVFLIAENIQYWGYFHYTIYILLFLVLFVLLYINTRKTKTTGEQA